MSHALREARSGHDPRHPHRWDMGILSGTVQGHRDPDTYSDLLMPLALNSLHFTLAAKYANIENITFHSILCFLLKKKILPLSLEKKIIE